MTPTIAPEPQDPIDVSCGAFMEVTTDPMAAPEPEGWGFPQERGRSHYFRNGRSLCGKVQRHGIRVAGNLEEPCPDDCAACSRIGAKEVTAWYAEHGDDADYARTHDDGKVRQ